MHPTTTKRHAKPTGRRKKNTEGNVPAHAYKVFIFGDETTTQLRNKDEVLPHVRQPQQNVKLLGASAARELKEQYAAMRNGKKNDTVGIFCNTIKVSEAPPAMENEKDC